MTSSTVKTIASRARALAAIRNCSGADRLFNQAWQMLNLFAEQQAAAGESPADAVALHKNITKSYVYFQQHCHGTDTSMSGLGAGDTESRDTIFAVIGAVASVGLVALGFHAAKR